MRREALELALSELSSDFDGIFRKASLLGRYILEHGSADAFVSQQVIRLRAAIDDDPDLERPLRPIADGLLREVGLFPYIEATDDDWRDQIALEAFRAPEEMGLVFHRAQQHAFDKLLSGKSVVLSAPTSFGKTLLIDALIAAKLPDVVVVVVPTLALLDEQRRRLFRRFQTRYQVITRGDQSRDTSLRTIFVLTQERLLDREDIDEINLFVIDEFYKLSGTPDDVRCKALNIAFRKYRNRSQQIFLLGPNVDANIPREAFDAVVIDSSSVTVATEIHDYRRHTPKTPALADLILQVASKKTLIFCKSPASARRLAKALIDLGVSFPRKDAQAFSLWLKENYHPEWVVATALEKGIGIHHGAVPRSIGQRILSLFDTTDLNLLICTSTLIEGVNTKAENIVIYDKKIENRNFDYFAYQNIKGRAGRFGSYLIGHVYLFEDAPTPEQFVLDIPSLESAERVSDEFLIGFEGFGDGAEYARRRDKIVSDISLPADIIAKLAVFRIDDIKEAASIIESEVRGENPLLLWSGRTEYQHLAATLQLTWKYFARKSPLQSGRQASFYAMRLLQARGDVYEYLRRLTEGKSGDQLQIEIEKGFKAMRSIEFHIPAVLAANEILVNFYCAQYGVDPVEYGTMARMVESYFLPPHVKALEEMGVPTPVGLKISGLVRSDEALDAVIRSVLSFRGNELARVGVSQYERDMLLSAL